MRSTVGRREDFDWVGEGDHNELNEVSIVILFERRLSVGHRHKTEGREPTLRLKYVVEHRGRRWIERSR